MLLKVFLNLGITLTIPYFLFGVIETQTSYSQMTTANPQVALKQLLEGNERYTNDKLLHPNRTTARREALTKSQAPFAIILGCSDSRVSPEIIFDQGIGDLFVVRVAGNVVGPIELASVEFSAVTFGSSIILVLGHENCGAVTAVLNHQTKDIEPIAVKIEAALQENQKIKFSENPLENAIKRNVIAVVKQLRSNDVLSKLIDQKKIEIVGGYYQLASGKVELCCPPPQH
jgi:carbonic anhydrase